MRRAAVFYAVGFRAQTHAFVGVDDQHVRQSFGRYDPRCELAACDPGFRGAWVHPLRFMPAAAHWAIGAERTGQRSDGLLGDVFATGHLRDVAHQRCDLADLQLACRLGGERHCAFGHGLAYCAVGRAAEEILASKQCPLCRRWVSMAGFI